MRRLEGLRPPVLSRREVDGETSPPASSILDMPRTPNAKADLTLVSPESRELLREPG